MEDSINRRGIEILKDMGILSDKEVVENQTESLKAILAVNEALDNMSRIAPYPIKDSFQKILAPVHDLLTLLKKWEASDNPAYEPFKLILLQIISLWVTNPMIVLDLIKFLEEMVGEVIKKEV